MRIVITGALGQLGKALQTALAGADLILVDVPDWDITDPGSVSRMADLKPADRPASSSQNIAVQWEVWVRRGRTAHTTFLELQWEIYKALLNWEDKLKAVLLVNETNDYCRNCDTVSVRESVLVGQKSKGWRAAWVGVCDCWFQHSWLVS